MNSSATLTGCDDIIKRLRDAIAEHPLSPIHGYAADIAAMLDRLEAAERELERERMRLVACGVVAGANTPESAANARQMHPDYLSGSCDAVACAVDREMALRAENERLVAKIGELVDACALLRVENSKSEREALCWQELDRFISTCDPANAAAWKRLRKRIDEDIGRAIDAASPDNITALLDRLDKAERVPLSEEQIRALVQPMDWPPSVTEIVRAVESAHGIRSGE